MSTPTGRDEVRAALNDLDATTVADNWGPSIVKSLQAACVAADEQVRAWSRRDPAAVADGWALLLAGSRDGEPLWRHWLQELVMAVKGGRGIQNCAMGHVMLDVADDALPVSGSLWWRADDAEALANRCAARYAVANAPALGVAVGKLLSAWRDTISESLERIAVAEVELHRAVWLSEGDAISTLAGVRRSTPAAVPLHTVLPQAALASWTTSLDFAMGWSPTGPRTYPGRAVVFSALVPTRAIWMAPGYGEGELLVSPMSPEGTPVRLLRVRTPA